MGALELGKHPRLCVYGGGASRQLLSRLTWIAVPPQPANSLIHHRQQTCKCNCGVRDGAMCSSQCCTAPACMSHSPTALPAVSLSTEWRGANKPRGRGGGQWHYTVVPTLRMQNPRAASGPGGVIFYVSLFLNCHRGLCSPAPSSAGNQSRSSNSQTGCIASTAALSPCGCVSCVPS